jgi:hypothetical protein
VPNYISEDTPGERRFARLLEAKLEYDNICWYNVPSGPDSILSLNTYLT